MNYFKLASDIRLEEELQSLFPQAKDNHQLSWDWASPGKKEPNINIDLSDFDLPDIEEYHFNLDEDDENIYHEDYYGRPSASDINRFINEYKKLQNNLKTFKKNYLESKELIKKHTLDVDINGMSVIDFFKNFSNIYKDYYFHNLAKHVFGLRFRSRIEDFFDFFGGHLKIFNVNKIKKNIEKIQDCNRYLEENNEAYLEYKNVFPTVIESFQNKINLYLSNNNNVKNLIELEEHNPNIKSSFIEFIKNNNFLFLEPIQFFKEINKSDREEEYTASNLTSISKNLISAPEIFYENEINTAISEIIKEEKEYFKNLFEEIGHLKINENEVKNFLKNYFDIDLDSIFLTLLGSNYQKGIETEFYTMPTFGSLVLPIKIDFSGPKQKLLNINFSLKEFDKIKNFIKNECKNIIKYNILFHITSQILSMKSSNLSFDFDALFKINEYLYLSGGFGLKNQFIFFKKIFPEAEENVLLKLRNYFNKIKEDKKISDIYLLPEIGETFKYLKSINLISKILDKENKLNFNNIINIMSDPNYHSQLDKINVFIADLVSLCPKNLNNYLINNLHNYIRSISTIDADLNNLKEIINIFHNQAANLELEIYINILNNPNMISLSKTATVKKIFSFYSNFVGIGKFSSLKAYQKDIDSLLELNMLNPNYLDNFKIVTDFFEKNEKFSVNSGDFNQIIKACNAAETDLQFIKDAKTYKKYFNKTEPKDKNLFKINFYLSPNLRFRALEDKDPRHLRIGVETDCCQRVGGAAESCVIDSFINQFAGILILEQKDEYDIWQLISQSYFHYVPEDNGFILDNVESSDFGKLLDNQNLAEYYYKLNEHLKSQGFSYLLAGKGFSDIKTSLFETSVQKTDPRIFNEQSYETCNFYSDYKYSDAMDFSKPTFINKGLEKKITNAINTVRYNLLKLSFYKLNYNI